MTMDIQRNAPDDEPFIVINDALDDEQNNEVFIVNATPGKLRASSCRPLQKKV